MNDYKNLRTFHAGIEVGLQAVNGEVLSLSLVTYVLVAKRARGSYVNLPLWNDLQW